jgi:hypothetical protein
MKKLLALAPLLMLAALTGCQAAAPVAAPATPWLSPPAFSVTGAPEGPAPRILTGSQLRRVLAADASATLWGINYSLSEHRSWSKKRGETKTFRVSYAFAGRGELIKADYDRFVYQVPDDQVLIINKLVGGHNATTYANPYQGSVILNGFGVQIFEQDAHYVFGPGELVVIKMQPNFQYAFNGDDSGYTNYYPLSLSGYVGSPDLLAQASGTRATK